MADDIVIDSGTLTARIACHGAELQSLTDAHGRELMSDGDPAYWQGRAPLLFPIVGQLNDGAYRVDGAIYTMPKHGIARRSEFDVVAAHEAHAILRLTDSSASRAQYPFAFQLDMAFEIQDASLTMTATVTNPGAAPLPFSFGFHPAFAWPLPFGDARGDHVIEFSQAEPGTIAVLTADGLIAPHSRATPVIGRTLALHDDLFTADALIWPTLASQSLRYGMPDGPALDIAFPDTRSLGIWTKPGARFVCVEPWAGLADPDGFTGKFTDKPGVMSLPPGAARSFRMTVSLNA